MITFRYHIKPTCEQVATLSRHVEICRQLYNYLLGELNSAREQGKLLSKATSQAFLPVWKEAGFPELREVYSKVAQMVVQQLYANLAGLAAKKGRGYRVGQLRFKGRGWYTSLNYNQSGFFVDWERGTIRLSKVGVVKATIHRALPPEFNIKGIVIKKTRVGKWFACIQCEDARDLADAPQANYETYIESSLAAGGSEVGIDLGIAHFAADSGGHFAESPKFLELSLAKVKRLQKSLSRKKKASKRRQKVKFALAKLHEKVTNQRRDFLHKLSRHYIRHYDVICAENLAVARMMEEKRTISSKAASKSLHRHIADAGWRMFLNMLAYKAQSAGKLTIFVDPRGTSQECGACGASAPKNLWDRVHTCPQCGFTPDRDTNASLVIKKRGTGRTPSPVELTPLLRLAGASAGVEAGTLPESRCIIQ